MALLELFEAWSMWRSAKAARDIASEQKRFNDFMIERHSMGPDRFDPARVEPTFGPSPRFRSMESDELHRRNGFGGYRHAADVVDADFVPVEPTDWRLPAPSNDLLPFYHVGGEVVPLGLPAPRRSRWRRFLAWLTD